MRAVTSFEMYPQHDAEDAIDMMLAGTLRKNFSLIARRVPCPTCGVQPSSRCKSNRVWPWKRLDDAHEARRALAILAYE